MTREIKFRAWNKEKSVMCFKNEDNSSDYWDGVDNSEVGMVNHILNPNTKLWDRYVFMQFTGLKDKNGVEIYEGDILKTDYNEKYKCEVYWGDEGLWCLKWNGEGKDYNYRMFACEKLVVIGNIYQNPELLK